MTDKNTNTEKNKEVNFYIEKSIPLESIKKNSIIVIKAGGEIDNAALDKLQDNLQTKLPQDCVFIVLAPNEEFSLLNEEEMREVGWVRVEKS